LEDFLPDLPVLMYFALTIEREYTLLIHPAPQAIKTKTFGKEDIWFSDL